MFLRRIKKEFVTLISVIYLVCLASERTEKDFKEHTHTSPTASILAEYITMF